MDKKEQILFRDLSGQEEREFRQWARENYGVSPSPAYHPVVNDELGKIKKENQV